MEQTKMGQELNQVAHTAAYKLWEFEGTLNRFREISEANAEKAKKLIAEAKRLGLDTRLAKSVFETVKISQERKSNGPLYTGRSDFFLFILSLE